MSEKVDYSEDPYIDGLISRISESWKCRGAYCADSCDSHPCLLVSGKELAG